MQSMTVTLKDMINIYRWIYFHSKHLINIIEKPQWSSLLTFLVITLTISCAWMKMAHPLGVLKYFLPLNEPSKPPLTKTATSLHYYQRSISC